MFDFRPTHEHILTGRELSLRVPIANLQTTTHAFFPDETHNTIRRVFVPHFAPHTKRHFCGFCGTQLTNWTEDPPEEAEWVRVNLGSLKSESMDKLEDSGILGGVDEDEDGKPSSGADGAELSTTGPQGREVQGNPWFEEIIEGSELGKIRKRRGGKSSADGSTRVEWEVMEFNGEEVGTSTTGKRKLGSLAEGDDVAMRGN